MIGQPVQRAPFENQLQVERQQNLEKINKLKQTLEAAQQQEQQYKTQLERISHLKMSPLQEALQAAQQAEMQYKMIEVYCSIYFFRFVLLHCYSERLMIDRLTISYYSHQIFTAKNGSSRFSSTAH